MRSKAKKCRDQIEAHLTKGIIPFWLNNSIDKRYGGYITSFDVDGNFQNNLSDKYLVTQTRMIWGFSRFYRHYKDKALLEAANQGISFFIKHFWDEKNRGWHWRTARDGSLKDNGKLVYGQSFAIYALAEHYLATGEKRSLEYALHTFNILQQKAADKKCGGYYENFEADWTLSPGGASAGDRKSLDIHMHLMEAFSILAVATKSSDHLQKLEEIRDLILSKMIEPQSGCGRNQFTLDFVPQLPIIILRTWIAERPGSTETAGSLLAETDLTSYAHNLEFGWLLVLADEILGQSSKTHITHLEKIGDHTLKYGYDNELGGVFREGPFNGPATDTDKEFWQNAEALVGFLQLYQLTSDKKYFDAFLNTWDFSNTYLINHKLGEWYTCTNREGKLLSAEIGNPWKGCYHTGRAGLECALRLDKLLQ